MNTWESPDYLGIGALTLGIRNQAVEDLFTHFRWKNQFHLTSHRGSRFVMEARQVGGLDSVSQRQKEFLLSSSVSTQNETNAWSSLNW